MIATLARPRLIPLLSVIAGALIAAYVVLMVMAILFAALQTQLAQNTQDKQMEIGKLEGTYYASIAQLDATDPRSLGYVKPGNVRYVTQAPLQGLSFAD